MRKLTLGIPLLVLSAVFADQNSSRIDQIEKELQEIKASLSRLNAILSPPDTVTASSSQLERWQAVANWRKLETGFSPSQVRQILGEPFRIDGGTVATWKYSNGGRVTFMSNRLYSWSEPDGE